MPIQMKMGRHIGQLYFKVNSKRADVVRRNIELCFPNLSKNEQKALIQKNFEETGKALFDAANAWFWSEHKMRKHMKPDGLEHLSKAHQSSQGFLLFYVHTLAIEAGNRAIGLYQEGHAVYRPNDNPCFEYIINRGRLKSAKTMIPKRNIRSMFKVLRNGGSLWYSADQDFGRSTSIFAPFFAVKDTDTITATSTLARTCNAQVVPMYFGRSSDDRFYEIQFKEPLNNFPSESEYDDTVRINKVIESIITQNTKQYMWLHRRFKKRPENQPSLYE